MSTCSCVRLTQHVCGKGNNYALMVYNLFGVLINLFNSFYDFLKNIWPTNALTHLRLIKFYDQYLKDNFFAFTEAFEYCLSLWYCNDQPRLRRMCVGIFMFNNKFWKHNISLFYEIRYSNNSFISKFTTKIIRSRNISKQILW